MAKINSPGAEKSDQDRRYVPCQQLAMPVRLGSIGHAARYIRRMRLVRQITTIGQMRPRPA
jgi:hypothetical protein